MSLRKNQLRKMTLDEIITQLSKEVDSDNIKLIHSYVNEKNNTLKDKKNNLLEQIEILRRKIQKNTHTLNVNIKDRIQKKQKMIIDKDSRPTTENMTELMDLFTYLENQNQIILRNCSDVTLLVQQTKQKQSQLENQSHQRLKYDDLDKKYQQLNKQCQEQELIKQNLINERNQKRAHYANIQKTIEQCRRQYEIVENNIRDKERQLIQLVTYYDSRKAEDNNALIELPEKAVLYQQQLLKAQSRLNQCEDKHKDRLMQQIESKIFFQQ